MIIAYTEQEYNQAKNNDLLKIICKTCKTEFLKNKKKVYFALNKMGSMTCDYCCKQCQTVAQTTSIVKPCGNCGNLVIRNISSSKTKSGNVFCTHSCSATYSNTHKTTGCRRSKLEKWLERRLTELYPELDIHFNRKDTIKSELDIYIPALKTAFELNGIFHYEPIYGSDKLNQIQNNDSRKIQTCLEQGIELCIIDITDMKHFRPQSAQKYLDIIVNLIVVGGAEIESALKRL